MCLRLSDFDSDLTTDLTCITLGPKAVFNSLVVDVTPFVPSAPLFLLSPRTSTCSLLAGV